MEHCEEKSRLACEFTRAAEAYSLAAKALHAAIHGDLATVLDDVVSGGKNLRGPQCSGILMGRKSLIEAAYTNSAPNNYFARIAKVGKEEIVGLLTAVELYLKRDHQKERREWTAMLDRVAARLKPLPGVRTEFITNQDYSHSPRLSVQWDEGRYGVTVDGMVQRLREGDPSIEASDMTKFRPAWKGLGVFPYCLTPGEEIIVADRIAAILKS